MLYTFNLIFILTVKEIEIEDIGHDKTSSNDEF